MRNTGKNPILPRRGGAKKGAWKSAGKTGREACTSVLAADAEKEGSIGAHSSVRGGNELSLGWRGLKVARIEWRGKELDKTIRLKETGGTKTNLWQNSLKKMQWGRAENHEENRR